LAVIYVNKQVSECLLTNKHTQHLTINLT